MQGLIAGVALEVKLPRTCGEQELVSGFNGQQFFGYAEGYYNAPRRYFLTVKYNTD